MSVRLERLRVDMTLRARLPKARRLVLAGCVVVSVLLGAVHPAGDGFSLAQEPPPKKAGPKAATAEILTETAVIEQVTASVDRALEYLATQQQADGKWDGNNAPNALALLAFMGRGHVPGRGPYRDVLEKGKKFVIRTQNDAGLFVPQRAAGSGPTYQQGLATLAMAEMYGMDPDEKLEEALRKAVDLILKAQSKT